jgi:hypothetical protein
MREKGVTEKGELAQNTHSADELSQAIE